MLVNVIRPFPFSRDGRTQEHAATGERDIPDALVPGLIAEGYIDPEGHPPVAFSAARRRAMVDRVTELFRAHMEALSDEQLVDTLASAERQTAEAAERLAYETKIPPPLETGEPERLPEPLDLSGLASIAEVDLTKAPVGDAERFVAALPATFETLNQATPAIEIPSDWKAQHHKTRVALAKKLLGGEGELTTAEADEVIAEEVARRATAPAEAGA